MIRRAMIVKHFLRGGERRKIGQPRKAGIPEWNRVERFDPEG
jgi:hypothetical protein